MQDASRYCVSVPFLASFFVVSLWDSRWFRVGWELNRGVAELNWLGRYIARS